MAAAALLSSLHTIGAAVSLTPEGKVRVEAPEGALTDDLQDQLRRERDELVALLETFKPGQERGWGFASFASAASAAGPDAAQTRTLRTQRTQVCSPVLAGGNTFSSCELAAIPPGLPAEWRDGLERLASVPRHPDFSEARWALGVWWARQIASEHGVPAFVMGWNAEDLFGLDPAAPSARYDGMGLSFFLKPECQIVSLNDERAVIRHPRGAESRFWVGRCVPESRPAWDLI